MNDPFRQTWWQDNLPEQLEKFIGWVGQGDAPTKVAVRERVIAAGHRSILDCGCGLCVDYDEYRAASYDIAYRGLDVTPFLVERAKSRGLDVVEGSIEDLPFSDGEVDVVHARHVLEHLPHYRSAMEEAVRVASREVLFVFFIKPIEEDEVIDFNADLNLFHNRYDRRAIDFLLGALPRVAEWRWIDLSDTESLLSIDIAAPTD